MKKVISLFICLSIALVNFNILVKAENADTENNNLITVKSYENSTFIFVDNETNEEIKVNYNDDEAIVYIDNQCVGTIKISYNEENMKFSNIAPFAWGTTYQYIGYVRLEKTEMIGATLSVIVGVLCGKIINYITGGSVKGADAISGVLSVAMSAAGGLNSVNQNDLYVRILALATTDCEILYKHKYELYNNRTSSGQFTGYMGISDPAAVWYDTPWNYSYSAGCRVLVNEYPYN